MLHDAHTVHGTLPTTLRSACRAAAADQPSHANSWQQKTHCFSIIAPIPIMAVLRHDMAHGRLSPPPAQRLQGRRRQLCPAGVTARCTGALHACRRAQVCAWGVGAAVRQEWCGHDGKKRGSPSNDKRLLHHTHYRSLHQAGLHRQNEELFAQRLLKISCTLSIQSPHAHLHAHLLHLFLE